MNEKIQKTIENLKVLDFFGKDSNENLSNLCSALYGGKPDFGWTKGACEWLRQALIGVFEQLDPADWSNEYLAEVGLVRLPKDADGEYIHIGDVMQWPDGVTYDVVGVGSGVFFYNDCDGAWCTSASDKTHYHKQTIEEMLTEYAENLLARHNDCDPSDSADDELELVVEYAAKLREVMADE